MISPFSPLLQVIWKIANACDSKRPIDSIKSGEVNKDVQNLIGQVTVVPEAKLPKSSPTNGTVSLTQETGAPEAYINKTHCPVINYKCTAQLLQSFQIEDQDIYHQIDYSAEINITVVGKLNFLNNSYLLFNFTLNDIKTFKQPSLLLFNSLHYNDPQFPSKWR